jgi:hypothetical protein
VNQDLYGAAINIWPLKEKREGVCLYHQAAILCIDKASELHISVKDNKIIIYLINKDTTRFISPNIASTVTGSLRFTMHGTRYDWAIDFCSWL